MDKAANQIRSSISIDIGARVGLPSITLLVLILTITATKHSSDLVGTSHKYIRLGNSSSITTAIDSFNASIITTLNDNRRLLTSCRIVGQVTTAIDSSQLISRIVILIDISRFRIITRSCLSHSHSDIIQRITIQIVTAKYSATLHYICISCICIIGNDEGYTIRIYKYFTTDISSSISSSIVKADLLSQATTISIAKDGSLIQINSCRSIGCRSYW